MIKISKGLQVQAGRKVSKAQYKYNRLEAEVLDEPYVS